MIAAHRGVAAGAAENTIAAFTNAIDVGADMIEFDVRRTRDGEMIAFHDASAAALHLRVPVRIECALWDTHVPPPGQFGVANAVAAAEAAGTGARLELAVHRAGHAEYPGWVREMSDAFSATRAHIARVTGNDQI